MTDKFHLMTEPTSTRSPRVGPRLLEKESGGELLTVAGAGNDMPTLQKGALQDCFKKVGLRRNIVTLAQLQMEIIENVAALLAEKPWSLPSTLERSRKSSSPCLQGIDCKKSEDLIIQGKASNGWIPRARRVTLSYQKLDSG